MTEPPAGADPLLDCRATSVDSLGVNAKRRIAELRQRIERADDLYYNRGEPELTDTEYDALFRELGALEQEHPELLLPGSPTRRVGAPLAKGSRFESAEHLAPMLSIESLTEAEQVVEFEARIRRYLDLAEDEVLHYAVEPKFDGVSANLLYENGQLVRGLSRGDGVAGEVITQNLRTIRNIPLRLHTDSPPPRIEVRGEVILSRTAFEELRQRTETTTDTPFRNARNAVAGTLKLLDPAIVAQRRLEFICWGIGHADGLAAETYAQVHGALSEFGFKVADLEVVDSTDGILAFHRRLEEQRSEIEYEMDGIVAKINRLDLQRRLGRTARSPRWMLAYKFAAKSADTIVTEIRSQVGRTGAVTPVAELEPVELAGVTVRRATLHNWVLLADRDVREGDHVIIQRAGDVIPEVVSVHLDRRPEDSRPVQPPERCPSCDSPLQLEGAHLYCQNVECAAQLKGRIVHLASRRALDIDRLGPKYVDQLIAAGLIRTLEDVFALPEHKDEILALERWAERSYEKLTSELERAAQPSFDRFLYGLGIRHVGEQTARDLADAFENLDQLSSADEDALIEVDGVGPEVAKSIHAFFALPANLRFFEAIEAKGVAPRPVAHQKPAGPLAGRVFCFTGSFQHLSRDEARALATDHGAKTTTSITKKVTDVVIGEKAGSKADKARDLGLTVHSESEFLELVAK